MISALRSFGSVCHCLAVYPLTNASYSGRPISEIAFSSRFDASAVSISEDCSAISARASSGVWLLPKNWLISARFIGNE